jgi:hypothetical protein
LHYIDLLVRYDPAQLLAFLKSKSNHYREQDALDIINKYSSTTIIPSTAYLLERLGQYTETFELLLRAMHQWQTLEHLYQTALDCVHFCQRTTIKLKDKHEREQLWLRFLDEILLISSSKSFDYEQIGAIRRIYGEILNSMIGYVTLPAILERIMRTDAVDITRSSRRCSEAANRSTFEIRQLIQSMLENCSVELRLLETTRRLLQRDLNDDIDQMCTLMNRSVPIRQNQCAFCQKCLHQPKQEQIDSKQTRTKFVIFACRHAFHLHCLIEIQREQSNTNFCPQCQTSRPSDLLTVSNALSTADNAIVPPVLRRLTYIPSDINDQQIALNNRQQQVIKALLERKRLDIRHLNVDQHNAKTSKLIEQSKWLSLPDKWREYISSSD